MRGSNLIRILVVTAVILALPLVAMQFVTRVNWGSVDFLVAGVVLFASGPAFEFAVGRLSSGADNLTYRFAVGVSVLGVLLLVWVNLAVGIIGHEGNPANLMCVGALLMGVAGVMLAHMQAVGLEDVLWVTAGAQILITLIALTAFAATPSVTLVLNGVFVGIWVGAALLFRHARRVVQQR